MTSSHDASGRRHRQFVGPDGRVHDATVTVRRSGSQRSVPTPGASAPPPPPRRRRHGTPWWKRLDRLAAWWLTPLAARQRGARLAAWTAWGTLLLALVAWALLAWRSEQWLLPTLLLYGPRLLLGIPLAVIALVVVLADRRLVLPMALAAIVLVGPISGGRLGWRGWFASGAPVSVRVMTLNLGARMLDRPAGQLLLETGADVWAIQECSEDAWAQLRAGLPGWYGHRALSLCTVSRWPITAIDSMDRADFERSRERGSMAAAFVLRAQIATPSGPISLVNLHLATARWGLSGFLPSELRAGGSLASADDQFVRNAILRRYESERAADFARRQPAPVIVAGDFNMPVESAYWRQFWSDFDDAFEQVGRGFGFTKFERRIRIRIDHVLSLGALRPTRVVVGPDVGSDHRPVVASYARR